MSLLQAQPELLLAAKQELQGISTVITAGNAVAQVPITEIAPAAADVVSLLTAAQFTTHARLYQILSGQAAAVRQQLESALGVSASSYSATEAANNAAFG